MKRMVAWMVLGLALSAPGPALAAAATTPPGGALTPGATPTNPLSPGLPQPTASIPTASTAAAPAVSVPGTTTGGNSGLSGTSALGIVVGAVLILAGIAFYIWRDARKRAPVKTTALPAGGPRAGSKAKPKPRKPSPAERRRRKRGRAR